MIQIHAAAVVGFIRTKSVCCEKCVRVLYEERSVGKTHEVLESGLRVGHSVVFQGSPSSKRVFRSRQIALGCDLKSAWRARSCISGSLQVGFKVHPQWSTDSDFRYGFLCRTFFLSYAYIRSGTHTCRRDPVYLRGGTSFWHNQLIWCTVQLEVASLGVWTLWEYLAEVYVIYL